MKKIYLFYFAFFVIFHISTFEIGDRVLADWSGDEYWYPGTVIDEVNGEYHISFDDFDREWLTAYSLSYEELNAGDSVESRWLGEMVYYPGTIIERSGNAVYIEYDDGDEEMTTINHLRILEP